MKKLTLVVFVSVKFVFFSQTPDFNLQKYWFYRERFKNFFVSTGTDQGQGLAVPMMVEVEPCKPNYVNPDKGSIPAFNFRLDDLPAHQGWYIGMLATEYALLTKKGSNTDELKYELYCALYALNRLDQTDANIGNTELDGFMVREDFPSNFFDLHPEIQVPDNDAIQEKWNINRCTNHGGYSNECFHALEDDKAKYYGTYNEQALSLDHYSRILMGLALVVKYVDEFAFSISIEDSQPVFHEFQDGEIFIKKEAQRISDRIITYFSSHKWLLMMPDKNHATDNLPDDAAENNCILDANAWGFQFGNEPCRNCPEIPILTLDGYLQAGVIAPRGCNATYFSTGLGAAGGAIASDFDMHSPKYVQYNLDPISTSLSPIWESIIDYVFAIVPPGKKPATLAYLSMLAAVGNSWPDFQIYFSSVDITHYNWGFYNLLHGALWDREPIELLDFSVARINQAPCNGNDGEDYMWYEYNSLEQETFAKQGNPDFGEIKNNGLDYMLLFNLYLLTHPDYVDYNVVQVGDVHMSYPLPQVLSYPNCPPVYLTAEGSSSTGTSYILPKKKEIFCIGKIYTGQFMQPVNLTGSYSSYHLCSDNNPLTDDFFPIDIEVSATEDAVISVQYKATNDIEFEDGFNADGCADCEFTAIEFKCNEAGTAYERHMNPNQNSDTSSVALKPVLFAETKKAEQLRVKPNPTEGSFQVDYVASNTSPDVKMSLLVMDLYGKEIWREEARDETSAYLWHVNLPGLSKGVYLVKILENGAVKETKQLFLK